MVNPLSQTDITYTEHFLDSAAATDLPAGFVEFHRQNFCRYFQLTPDEFRGKSVLDSGAGPGKHAAVLHLMGAHVTAVDLLASNVRAIERLKERHSLDNLVAYRADLMCPLTGSWPKFELVSVHNWLHRVENPAKVLENLLEKVEEGGRIYISVPQSGTFRFFINRIARVVLTWSDREVVKGLIPHFFPLGFGEFDNPNDIYFENVLEDFFVPHTTPLGYESLVKFLDGLGCEVLAPHNGHQNLYAIDDEQLKVGLIKRSQRVAGEPNEARAVEQLEYQVDEFDTARIKDMAHRELITESVKWALEAIELLRATSDQDVFVRAAFCLGLYRLRGGFSRVDSVEQRHMALQAYLKRLVTSETSSIRAWKSSESFYTGDRS